MRNGFATYTCVIWSIFPLFHLLTSESLGVLERYCFKLICMITSEKNRAQNCLTVSNLKLDDVFSDIFGKSSCSITEQILQHPGEKFDVSPFIDNHCKTPIEEIQDTVDKTL